MHEAFSEKNENIFLAARRELRFTRERAAELLQWINEDRLEKIEKGISPPRPEEVLQIARVYSLTSHPSISALVISAVTS